jgi:hypothetical protein
MKWGLGGQGPVTERVTGVRVALLYARDTKSASTVNSQLTNETRPLLPRSAQHTHPQPPPRVLFPRSPKTTKALQETVQRYANADTTVLKPQLYRH